MSASVQGQSLDRLMGMLNGHRIAQALSVATRLDIADHLAERPMTANELADLTSAKPAPLYQVLRAVASRGVFAEDDVGRFRNTPMSEYLRRDAPGPARLFGVLNGEMFYASLGELMHTVRTGDPGFDQAFGHSFFHHLSAEAGLGSLFDSLMTALYGREVDAALETFDFSDVGQLLDVGGGRGTVARALLAKFPDLSCGLFDLPDVAARAEQTFAMEGLLDRCKITSGSFFDAIPSGYDTYLLKHVLHDWNDERCSVILLNCRRAIRDGGRLLILEYIVPSGNEPSLIKELDLAMLSFFGGKERTEAEFRELLERAGFRLERVVDSGTPLCILEASPG